MVNDIWISLVVATFVVYRISRMIAVEEGPFEVFTTVRTFFYHNKYPEWIQRGIVCPLCVGWWISLPLAIYIGVVMNFSVVGTLLCWQAIAGASTFLYRLEN